MVATSSRKPKHGIVTVEKAPQSRGTGEQKPGGGETEEKTHPQAPAGQIPDPGTAAPGGQVHGADPDPGRAQGKGEPRQREDQLQKADAVGADSPGTDRPEIPWTQTAGEDWLPSASWPRKTWRFPFSCAHPSYTLWAPAGKNTGRPP